MDIGVQTPPLPAPPDPPAMFPTVRTVPLGSRQIPGSPYSLTILQEGYSRPRADGTFEADCSVTLVRGGPVTALVDTGGPWGRRRLLDELEAVGVSPWDVTHVLCTHGHSDHVGNLNLFPSAALLVGFDLSCGAGVFLPHGLAQGVPYAPHPGLVEVVATPGHVRAHVSVVVRGTERGTVVVAGDLFEREGDEEVWRGLSEDPQRQEESRGWAVGVADVIVPGHGAAFCVLRGGGGGGEGGGGGSKGGAGDT